MKKQTQPIDNSENQIQRALNNFLEKEFSPLIHQNKMEGILIVDCLQNKMKKKHL
jgi:hypothetical protein